MEHRQTGGKADESVFGFFGVFIFFLNGTNVSSMLRRVRKESEGWQEGGGGVERERTLARLSALGWRGAREELADFGNPSFIHVKPSSAECGLTDITEPLTTDCL